MVVVVGFLHEINACPHYRVDSNSPTIIESKHDHQAREPHDDVISIYTISREGFKKREVNKWKGIGGLNKRTINPPGGNCAPGLQKYQQPEYHSKKNKRTVIDLSV